MHLVFFCALVRPRFSTIIGFPSRSIAGVLGLVLRLAREQGRIMIDRRAIVVATRRSLYLDPCPGPVWAGRSYEMCKLPSSGSSGLFSVILMKEQLFVAPCKDPTTTKQCSTDDANDSRVLLYELAIELYTLLIEHNSIINTDLHTTLIAKNLAWSKSSSRDLT